jgi:hypothetical protein
MRPRSFRLLVAGIAVAALIAGCGASETTPEDEASGTVDVFLEGCAERDSIAVQDTLTEGLRKAFLAAGDPVKGCAAIVLPPGAAREADPSSFASSELSEVAVDAGWGTATVSTPFGDYDLELEQSKGVWQISQAPRSPSELES